MNRTPGIAPVDWARIALVIAFSLALALVVVGNCACVTSGDLRRIETALADESKGVDEVKAEVEAVAAEVDARTKGLLEEVGEAGGLAGIAGLIGLHLWRNYTRKRALEGAKVS